MKLLTVGDSFTQGAELNNMESDSWPALLSKKIHYEVVNRGLGSGSNDYIFRTTISELLNDDYDLIIIAWSDYGRMEYCDEHGLWNCWPGRAPMWHSFEQDYKFRQELINWVTRHHNDYWLCERWMSQLLALQAILETQNIKYLMCKAFRPLPSIPKEFQNNNFNKLFNEHKFLGWPSESMMEWVGDAPKGPRGHFLEQGHQIVAEKIYEHIRHLGWVS
jgi:lysophospholipase L1-like esterase